MAKILIVDDEVLFSEALIRFLNLEGYDSFSASAGEDALRLVKSQKPEIVLLDIRMPGMDGLEVLKRLRQEKENENMAIIMLSARDEESIIMQALALGADDYLLKPFEERQLKRKIELCLAKAQDKKLPHLFYKRKD